MQGSVAVGLPLTKGVFYGSTAGTGAVRQIPRPRGPLPPAPSREGRGSRAGRIIVPRNNLGTHRSQRACRGSTIPAEPKNGKPSTSKQIRREPAHRIFNVARPTSAKIIEMIQKRITMVGSAQPFFSK